MLKVKVNSTFFGVNTWAADVQYSAFTEQKVQSPSDFFSISHKSRCL